MPTITSKINFPNRLMGGADEEPVIEEIPAKDSSSESVQKVPNLSLLSSSISSTLLSYPVEKSLEEFVQLEENSQNKQPFSANRPYHFCISQTPELVGNREVDEIIEYVRQNLQEAGRALATLSENTLKVEPDTQLECHKTISTSLERKREGYN
ncbi:PREDICTED: uncharacterized protein LOC108778848 [Cyphomyrmex costatus]|uniref:Uncharacterized protein n=1 Tax=Cyphomyrmex costatus TaxID=456900 RepID=A0A151IBJ8_9HYME|nr:PREDICTED: uncharacterized protein LOC108778848 [Cyphomyrmex costatus]KYM97015.1 hypothetical protein ALC62_12280 [Cyphomyrmex costatus]